MGNKPDDNKVETQNQSSKPSAQAVRDAHYAEQGITAEQEELGAQYDMPNGAPREDTKANEGSAE